MAEISNPILQKLDGLEARYEEVSTLITDPSVIADQNRYVKLTKEWKDLGDIMNARKRYINCLEGIREAKDILANETDPEMKDMAREELAANEELQPKLEEEIKILLIPKDPEDAKNVQMEIRAGTGRLWHVEIRVGCASCAASARHGVERPYADFCSHGSRPARSRQV